MKKSFIAFIGLMLWLVFAMPAYAAACTNLKPVHSLDDLLLQLYNNLDSDCLFQMTAQELSFAWEIVVLEDWNIQDIDDVDMEKKRAISIAESSKIYTDDLSNLYITKGQVRNLDAIEIKGTRDYLFKYSSFFKDGQFPPSLPTPYIIQRNVEGSLFIETSNFFSENNIFNNYKPLETYFWIGGISNLKISPIIVMSSAPDATLSEITLYRTIPSFIRRDVYEKFDID
ncbi:hypothetical protein [Paralysiella testudinis]|uniref:Uncharacterized protein n=1 Tax=Paralysiella testudinis TaxID=2809020 RepID=A0A892ZDS9_9NEIS|nr:hypothetical protein [Paralysiella testudinis]QRQ80658.1 hypothetical protein JQU52_07710 [Paralysiella testudinis]